MLIVIIVLAIDSKSIDIGCLPIGARNRHNNAASDCDVDIDDVDDDVDDDGNDDDAFDERKPTDERNACDDVDDDGCDDVSAATQSTIDIDS